MEKNVAPSGEGGGRRSLRARTYFAGVYTNWMTGRMNFFCVTDRDQIPASCRDLRTVKAPNKKQARHEYLFAQI